MSKPAARIGDMHVCPMVTPGTPPVPHVGGPITGPGVATVLIGGMPAAVMGDMCVCTGPPDTIILGSTGVLVGNKPVARMGDMCSHGGSIVVGCPTVLIGEVSPSGSPAVNTVVNSVMTDISGFEGGGAAGIAARQTMALTEAANEGAAFCELCEAARAEANASDASRGDTVDAPEEEDENVPIPLIKELYFTDTNGEIIAEVEEEETVHLVIESENASGEEVTVNLFDNPGDFSYNGGTIENNQLTLTLDGDEHVIELGVKINTD